MRSCYPYLEACHFLTALKLTRVCFNLCRARLSKGKYWCGHPTTPYGSCFRGAICMLYHEHWYWFVYFFLGYLYILSPFSSSTKWLKHFLKLNVSFLHWGILERQVSPMSSNPVVFIVKLCIMCTTKSWCVVLSPDLSIVWELQWHISALFVLQNSCCPKIYAWIYVNVYNRAPTLTNMEFRSLTLCTSSRQWAEL